MPIQNIVPYEAYRGSDDKYFVVGVGTEALWKRFVQVMNIQDDFGRDERFTINALRIKHRELLVPLLQNIFQQKPAAAWLENSRSRASRQRQSTRLPRHSRTGRHARAV